VAGAVGTLETVAVGVGVGVAAGVGGSIAVRATTEDLVVLTPDLGAPIVLGSVVPLIVGLGYVGLGVGLAIGLIDQEFLVAAPGVPFGVDVVLGGLGVRSRSVESLFRLWVVLGLIGGGVSSPASPTCVLELSSVDSADKRGGKSEFH